MDQVDILGRVIDNAGGSSQLKLKSPWFGGVGSCSQRKPAPDTGWLYAEAAKALCGLKGI